MHWGWQTVLGLEELSRQVGGVFWAQGAGAGHRCTSMARPAWSGNSWNSGSVGSGRVGSVFFTGPYVLGDLVGVALLLRVFGKLGRILPSAQGYRWSQDSGGGDERASRTPAGLPPPGAPLLPGAALPLGLTIRHRRSPRCQGLQGHDRDPLESSGPARALRPLCVLGNDGSHRLLSTYGIPGASCAVSPTLARTLQAEVIILRYR